MIYKIGHRLSATSGRSSIPAATSTSGMLRFGRSRTSWTVPSWSRVQNLSRPLPSTNTSRRVDVR